MAEIAAAPSLLVVDDDAELRALIGGFLAKHGYRVETAANAGEMDAKLAAAAFDLVVLDIMMPGEDGLSIARRLSTGSGPPVIMLSALGADTDRIVGLEIGADDYLPKPCNPRELLARVRAVLRRNAGREPADPPKDAAAAYRFAGWTLHPLRRSLVAPAGVAVTVSDGEFAVLAALVEHPQRVLTREQLLDYARGPDSDAYDRAIDTQVSRLRRKLGEHSDGELIRTIRNEGYMFLPRVTRG